MKAQKRATLFDDSDKTADLDAPELKINDDFAKRLTHNKKREELHRLQEKHKKPALHAKSAVQPDESESSSEEEDEDDGYIPGTVDQQIFDTLAKIRNRDRSIYDTNTQFFEATNGAAAAQQQGGGAKKSKRPMYLKDVIAQQALQHGAEGTSSDDEAQPGTIEPTYNQEQQQLKQQFLQAVEDNVDEAEEEEFGGGVLHKRAKPSKHARGGDVEAAALQQSLDEYFGSDQALSEGDHFLKQYVLNKGWVDKEEDGVPTYQDVVGEHDDEDEEFDEKAEQFETAYNFRFEEEGGRQMVTYPRVLEHTVRKTDERRKRKRAEKNERRAAEQSAQQAEVKRLKNLKNEEIQDRLARIRHISGQTGQQDAALQALLEGDFDPEDYDERMAAAFGEDYYEDEDEGPANILDAELQQQLNEMADYDSDQEAAQFDGQTTDQGRGEEEESEEGETDEDRQATAAAMKVERDAVSRLLAEYDKLDYEDDIGGLKTRFKYRSVPRQDYGLTTEEILHLSDKDLNQVVGMKQMAPYREDRGNFRPNYGKMNELRIGQQQQHSKHQQRQEQKQKRKHDDRPRRKSAGRSETGEMPSKQDVAVDPHAQRMKAFQKLTLQHKGPQSEASRKPKKQKAPEVSNLASPDQDATGLSKAAKKNMKRKAKRAARRV